MKSRNECTNQVRDPDLKRFSIFDISVWVNVHLIDFGDTREAAAFVAAVSRVLRSPQMSRPYGRVWSRGPSVYLDDSSLAAAKAAFGPLPQHREVQLPKDAQLIIDTDTPAMGIDEVSGRMI